MNQNRCFTWFCGPFILAFLISGCATSRPPVVDTWCNPQFSPTPGDKIALTAQPHPTPQSKVLGELLVKELQRDGFSVVPSRQANYLLACVMDEATEKQPIVHQWVDYAALAQAEANNQNSPSTAWIRTEQEQVGTFRFTSHYIRLLLYTNPQTHHGDFQLVWQGNINVNHPGSAAQEQVLLKTLLDYFGRQKNGSVSLAPPG